MKTLAVLVGSLQKNSMNKALAENLARIGKDLFEFKFADLGNVPMFNQDLEAAVPGGVTALKEAVKAADAVLLVTPEYNRSIPPVMKNALDWGSRPPGQSCWSGKPVAIAGLAPGGVGTAASQSQLRSLVVTLAMVPLGQPEIYLQNSEGFFDGNGKIAAERTEAFLRSFLEMFNAWIDTHKS